MLVPFRLLTSVHVDLDPPVSIIATRLLHWLRLYWRSLLSLQINFPVPGVHLPTVSKAPPSSRNYEGGFVTALAHKDLDLAVEAARMIDSPLFVGKVAEEIFRKVRGTEDWDARDFSIVYKWLEEKCPKSGSA